MSDIFDIKDMTEEDIKLQFITPALTAKWDVKKITMETSPANKFTDGKVHIIISQAAIKVNVVTMFSGITKEPL